MPKETSVFSDFWQHPHSILEAGNLENIESGNDVTEM
jgi:hypothetical protein